MSDIKAKVQNLDPNVKARNINDLLNEGASIYETLVAISKRANQISLEVRDELHSKLEEFSVSSDTIEEIHENKEQIEISKFYEKLPNPVIIATEEYLNKEFSAEYVEKIEEEAN
jgi:DNA-directed RNA polymerase subunit K/omega